ncbi:MAG TPA: TldD/PmbA family protein [Firmicutes bacterium]|nr:TldD/PmbA family protein [Bacillota bacterium]
MKAALDYCAKTLRKKNVDKFQCSLKTTSQHEMNLEGTEFSLIRTTKDNTLDISVIKANRKGSISLNRLDKEAIDEAADAAVELAAASNPDPDYDISPKQKAQRFSTGPKDAAAERMYELLKEYSTQVARLYPAVKLMETIFIHKQTNQHLINSNGVDFTADQGVYTFSSVFSSKDGAKTTSFNYTGFAMEELAAPLLQRGALDSLLRQSVEHLEAKPLAGKFTGDIILTPDCLTSILYFYSHIFLGDQALIAKTSPFRDKLGQGVAHEKLTLAAKPTSPQIADGYFITSDGFAAEDVTFIDRGILKSFMLSQYGSKKTGFERAKNQGGCWVVEPGDTDFEKLIAQIERGVLVARYSGGVPSPNGDFSGVAKNSYYIENGKIKHPVTETMIAGNLAEIFRNIKGISRQRINYGTSILPYILTEGVTISGK